MANGLTKRQALSIVHSVYDLIGLASPLVLRLKLCYQQILIKLPELGWDDKIPAKELDPLVAATEEILKLDSLEYERSYVPKDWDETEPQLVAFFDSSIVAQGYNIYLRF